MDDPRSVPRKSRKTSDAVMELQRPVIVSRQNALIKKARSLRQKKFRERHRAFLVEGPRTVVELLRSGWGVSCVLCDSMETAEKNNSCTGWDASSRTLRPAYSVRSDVLATISDVATHQGVIAVADMPVRDFSQWCPPRNSLVLVLDGIQDPGNFGTIVRTAHALGMDAVLATPDSADCYSPKCVRATAGSLFHIPVFVAPAMELLPKLTREAFQTVAASVEGARSVTDMHWQRRVAIIVGHETEGVRPGTISLAAETVRIPMSESAESLNVGAAAAVLMWEAVRQWDTGMGHISRSAE